MTHRRLHLLLSRISSSICKQRAHAGERRHGNRIAGSAAGQVLGASLTGPKPAEARVVQREGRGDNGALEVACCARCAGDYVLSVFDLATTERLFGSPFMVRKAAGRCSRHPSFRRARKARVGDLRPVPGLLHAHAWSICCIELLGDHRLGGGGLPRFTKQGQSGEGAEGS